MEANAATPDTPNYLVMNDYGKIYGPFSVEQLQTMANAGKLRAHHSVSPGDGQWQVVTTLPLDFSAAPETELVDSQVSLLRSEIEVAKESSKALGRQIIAIVVGFIAIVPGLYMGGAIFTVVFETGDDILAASANTLAYAIIFWGICGAAVGWLGYRTTLELLNSGSRSTRT